MRLRAAFTIVEMMIVFLLLAILAAVIVPKFAVATADARESGLLTDVQTLRRQVQLYKTQHFGRLPHLDQNGNAQSDGLLGRLMKKIDPTGRPNANETCGPYFRAWPSNPFLDELTASEVMVGQRYFFSNYTPEAVEVSPKLIPRL
ncbi:MAG: hypothetical protein QF577_05120 [Phycisphaerae bacterium]|jgi:general secretion pathway protein G|nr:hypothetical protein [Phycisphaerae bacterium]MDP7636912.1 hypothetical protein [Phycisphaerae bacterium]